MLYQIIIALLLTLCLLNLALNMKSLRVPPRKASLKNPPMVSVIVPARNEEANIGNCLESLVRQDYPDFEIIVVDDNSEDATARVAQSIAQRDHHVRVLCGEPLPAGWAGKPYACFQAAQQAKGDWLLFTDADTTHCPRYAARHAGHGHRNACGTAFRLSQATHG